MHCRQRVNHVRFVALQSPDVTCLFPNDQVCKSVSSVFCASAWRDGGEKRATHIFSSVAARAGTASRIFCWIHII